MLRMLGAVQIFQRNSALFPGLFQVLDRVSPELPDEVNDEIAQVLGKPMDRIAADHVMCILDDFVCDRCGQLMFRCMCPDD